MFHDGSFPEVLHWCYTIFMPVIIPYNPMKKIPFLKNPRSAKPGYQVVARGGNLVLGSLCNR
jgi:hypothetical protein